MKRTAWLGLTAVVAAFAVMTGPAAADGEDGPAYTLADIAWIAGHWQGKGFGGRVEEGWLGPAGGTMAGVFRLARDGATPLLEFLTITQEPSGVVYRFKHFSADYSAWEEQPITLRLTAASAVSATFENVAPAEGQPARLIYSRTDEATLRIRVDAAPEPFTLTLTRVE